MKKNSAVESAIKAAPDPIRARNGFSQLESTGHTGQFSPEQARILAALFSGSQAMGAALIAHPEWLPVLKPEHLEFPRREQGLRNEVAELTDPLLQSHDYTSALVKLREFKQREMLRIAARDLARLGHVSDITQDISDVADVCLSRVWEICLRQFTSRHGSPWHQDPSGNWKHTSACVLGMGKLGGQELNYSSDVDVLFVYSDEGSVFKEEPRRGKTPRASMPSHQFFNRVAETFIAEVSRMAVEGFLFRVDLRLRPEGESGPLCRSLAGYENYYAQWGQTWERMMLIKARGVAGSAALAAEFLELVQPFRYPRSINENVLHEVAAMKGRIESEVLKADEIERNVKLGRGGIREIEFVVQALQLLQAGRQPFLQGARTLPTLEKLEQYHLMEPADARGLAEAYVFLRDVEHRLQMEENLQTHTIPAARSAQERLARLMGFRTSKAFEAARRDHVAKVRAIFDRIFKQDTPEPSAGLPHEFSGLERQWKELLTRHSFRDADKAFHVLRQFVEGPGYVHVSPRTADLARQLLPRLLDLCPQPPPEVGRGKVRGETGDKQWLSDPDRVLTRLETFVEAYGGRSVLFELWNSNPAIFELLLLLFDRSEFLAELAIRTPDLVDDLVTSGRLRQRKTAPETLRDLRHGIKDADQKLWLRRYHQAELMRIGLRDILGLADPEQYLTELSSLADACLQYAVEVVMRKHKMSNPPFAIIGLGKLGGAEIDYGSDLDIIFVTDSSGKNLRQLQQMANEVMDLVAARTEAGLLFHMDARLRPDGEKGLLVNTIKAYEEYYRERAQLWEIQSITRTRAIAGSAKAGEKFQKLAAQLTDFRSPNLPLAAFAADWKQQIHKMRLRIEKERTPVGQDDLAIKTGRGGLVDAEFTAQALCMEHGWREANTLRALERAQEGKLLKGIDTMIASYRSLRRVEGILRRWSYEGETVLPDDPAPFYRVSVRCGFRDPDAFAKAVAKWRDEVRRVYLRHFDANPKAP